MSTSNDRGWNPYLAGGLSGLVVVLSVWMSGKYFGASTTFVKSMGMIEEIFDPERIAKIEYFIKETPQIDWQWMFVVGILIGSFVSAITSGSFHWHALPKMWQRRFGPSRIKRGLVAFAGGMIGMFGARLADG